MKEANEREGRPNLEYAKSPGACHIRACSAKFAPGALIGILGGERICRDCTIIASAQAKQVTPAISEPHRCSDASCQECRLGIFEPSGEDCAYCGDEIMLGELEYSVVRQGVRVHGLCGRQIAREIAEAAIAELRSYGVPAEPVEIVAARAGRVA